MSVAEVATGDGREPFDIDPEMEELLAAKRALDPASNDRQRLGWNDYAAAMQRPYPAGMAVVDTALPGTGGPSGSPPDVPVRIYRPRGVSDPSPCVVYIHGGAFIKGSLDSGDPIAWGIADHLGCAVVSLEYRLAPEHPFPAGVEDCYRAVHHLLGHGEALGIDGGRVAVWGDSAGGNMATACCLMARDRGTPPVVAQVLVYPCLTDELESPSYQDYQDAPVTTSSIDRAWDLYLGEQRPTSDPYAAPLKAANLRNLPPAFIHAAEIDCLADDARRYAARLEEAGNRVVFRVARRMIHGFVRARFSGPRSAAEFRAPCDFLRGELFPHIGRPALRAAEA